MAVSAESLIDLIEEAQKAYNDIQKELNDIASRTLELNKQRDAIAKERDAFTSSLERRYPGTPVPVDDSQTGPSTRVPPCFVEIPADDWSLYNRSEVVERSVKELTEEKGFATPAEVEAMLKSKNRSDNRDAIGAALAYLNRTKKVYSRARAEWVIGERP